MASKAQKEGQLLLALQAYQKGQIKSIRKAALAYNVPHSTLIDRVAGVACVSSRANSHKLTPTEEQVLIQWILSMDSRGYPPQVSAVRNVAQLLLQKRVGKYWPARFVKRHPTLRSQFNRKYDYQRAQCEDPALIEIWFRLVGNVIRKYGIQKGDICNFDETGFANGCRKYFTRCHCLRLTRQATSIAAR